MSAGERWRAKREALNRSIDEIAAELRISRRYLQGIEAGDYTGWPARVFSVGFIRTYARLLCEDPEPVIEEYLSAASDPHAHPEASRPVAAVRSQWVERARERGSRMVVYAVAALAVLVLGGILSWYSSRTTEIPPPPSPAPVLQQAVPAPGDNDAGQAALPAGVAPMPATAPAPAPENASISLPKPSAAPADNAASAARAAVPPFQMFLEATEQTWLMYSLDGSEPVDAMLYPGDRISIQARRRISLKLGNAGGVFGTLNGRRLPPFGERGQVRALTFGE